MMLGVVVVGQRGVAYKWIDTGRGWQLREGTRSGGHAGRKKQRWFEVTAVVRVLCLCLSRAYQSRQAFLRGSRGKRFRRS